MWLWHWQLVSGTVLFGFVEVVIFLIPETVSFILLNQLISCLFFENFKLFG